MFSADLFVDLVVKGTALLLMFTLLDLLLRTASAAVRHRLWGACFVTLLFLPVLVLSMPRWRMAILPSLSPIAIRDANDADEMVSSAQLEEGSQLHDMIAAASENEQQAPFELNSSPTELDRAAASLREANSIDPPGTLALLPQANEKMIPDHWIPSFSTAIWIAWSLGALVILWPLVSGLARNGSIQKRSQQVDAGEIANLFSELCNLLGIRRFVHLRQASMSIVPMTWGILKPVVIVPVDFRGWTPDSRRLVLLHELAHVKRLDVLYQSIARTTLALYWFHPLVWYALRRLRVERELACDDCVLALCDRPSRYAKQLLDIARRYQMSALPPAVAMAHRSGLEKRVRSLLDQAKSHRPIGPLAGRTMWIGSLIATMFVSVVRFEAAENKPIAVENGFGAELQEKTNSEKKSNRVVGRILDPNGKPIANARVVAVRVYHANTSWARTPERIAEIKSDANGNYHFDVPNQSERFSDGMHIEVNTVSIAATADGFGPAEVLVEEPAKNVDLVLASATKAIEGRIVDLEGEPVEGVRVRVTEVVGSPIPLSKWIEVAQANPSTHDNMTMAAPPLGKSGPPRLAHFPAKDPVQSTGILNLPETTTDKEGRFKIHGMGDDRLVTMRIDSPKISSSFLQAVTRKMETINMPMLDPRHRSGKIFGETFVYAAEPTQVIQGVLRDKQSQKPIVGATVELSQYSENLLGIEQFLVAKTDANGRYELVGIPKATEGARNTKLLVLPPSDGAYFRSERMVPKKSGLGPIECNIELTKGDWIEGKVVDSKTAAPIRSMVAYYPYLDNPNAKGHEAFDSGVHSMGYGEMFPTDQEGNFRVPGLNGKGMLRVVAVADSEYTMSKMGAPESGDSSGIASFGSGKLYHIAMPGNAMVEVAKDSDTPSEKVVVKLERLPSVKLRVVDEKGHEVIGYRMAGRLPLNRPTLSGRGTRYWYEQAMLSSTVEAFFDGKTATEQPLMFYHKEKNLGAIVSIDSLLKKSSTEVHEITLRPCSKIVGRLTTGKDQPLKEGYLQAGVGKLDEIHSMSLSRDGKPIMAPPQKRIVYAVPQFTFLEENGTFSCIVPPGEGYSMILGNSVVDATIFSNLSFGPGEEIDLGEIDVTKDAKEWPKPIRSKGVRVSKLTDRLEKLWEFQVEKGAFEGSPIIVDDRVYIGDLDGEFYCLNLNDGKPIWKKEATTGYMASAAYRSGILVIGDYDGKVHALEASGGKTIWEFETKDRIHSGADFFNDLVLVTSGDGALYALKLKTGELAWKYETGDQLWCSPTVVGNRTFLSGCDGQLHCVDLETGKAIGEKIPLGGPTGSTPAIAGDTVVVPTHAGPIVGLGLRSNKLLWTFSDPERSSEIRSSPAIFDGVAFVTTRNRRLLALNTEDGTMKWEGILRKRSDSSPIVFNGRVYVGATDGRLYAFDAKTGKEEWVHELPGGFVGSPAIASNRLVIASDKGTIFCFGNVGDGKSVPR